MAEISNIPQNPLWGGAADFLKAVREIAQELSMQGTPGVATNPLWKAVEGLVGKKPEIAEGLSYGFPPTTGSGQATQIKPEYAPDVADMLPQQGMATAVKGIAGKLAAGKALPLAAGMFVPVSRKSAQGAVDLAYKGASPEEVWQAEKLVAFPSGGGVPYYTKEIPAEKGSVALPDFSQGWQGKVGDVLDHPELYKEVPSLADASLLLAPAEKSWYGHQRFTKVAPAPGLPSFTSEVKLNVQPGNLAETNFLRGIEHEGQHHIQQTFVLPLGENAPKTVERFKQNPASYQAAVARMIYENRLAGNDQFADLVQDQYRAVSRGTISGDWLGDQIYRFSMGEMQAETVAQRSGMSDAAREFLLPRFAHSHKDYAGKSHNIITPYAAGHTSLPAHPPVHLPK